MRSDVVAALALLCVTVVGGCDSAKEATMSGSSLSEMTTQLRADIDALASELGEVTETRRDLDVACDPLEPDDSTRHEYVVAIRVTPGSGAALAGPLPEVMEQRGWTYTRRSDTSHQFEKDGYAIAVLVGAGGVATVGGSTACVADH